MPATRGTPSRFRKTKGADGNQDNTANHFARAMKLAKRLSPMKTGKPGGAKNDDGAVCIAISGDQGDTMNKTAEVSLIMNRIHAYCLHKIITHLFDLYFSL
jgi:hypothetical protein